MPSHEDSGFFNMNMLFAAVAIRMEELEMLRNPARMARDCSMLQDATGNESRGDGGDLDPTDRTSSVKRARDLEDTLTVESRPKKIFRRSDTSSEQDMPSALFRDFEGTSASEVVHRSTFFSMGMSGYARAGVKYKQKKSGRIHVCEHPVEM